MAHATIRNSKSNLWYSCFVIPTHKLSRVYCIKTTRKIQAPIVTMMSYVYPRDMEVTAFSQKKHNLD